MTDMERKTFCEALRCYGGQAQITMVFEEMAELQNVLCKFLRGRIDGDTEPAWIPGKGGLMAEYIERSAAIEAAKHAWAKGLEPSQYIEALPVADVAQVVYGRWEHLGGDEWCCSACGFVLTTEGSWDKPTKKYCEDCGAKMDGERKDGGDG